MSTKVQKTSLAGQLRLFCLRKKSIIGVPPMECKHLAWSASDMHEIPSKVITHKLNIDPKFKPIRRKRRSFASERQKTIDEEANKLLTTRFIREVHYPE